MLDCGLDVTAKSKPERFRPGISQYPEPNREADSAGNAAFAFGSALHLLLRHCAAGCSGVQQLFQKKFAMGSESKKLSLQPIAGSALATGTLSSALFAVDKRSGLGHGLRMETNTNTKPVAVRFPSIKDAKLAAPTGTKFIQTHSVMDDCGTGGICGFFATPQQEREYNDGMEKLASWG